MDIKRYIIPIILFLVVFICVFLPLVIQKLNTESPIPETKNIYTIKYGFTIYNRTDKLVKDADLWTFAPVKQTSNQYCVNVKASLPFEMAQDAAGNQSLCFHFNKIPPYARKVVVVTAEISFPDGNDAISYVDPAVFLFPETGGRIRSFRHHTTSQKTKR